MPNAANLPEPFQSTLTNISESGRIPYLSGMIKHACVCNEEHGSAVIRLGISGKREIQKMPCYWIMHIDENGTRQSYEAYFYKDFPFKSQKTPPRDDGSWTDKHITLDELLTWLLNGGPSLASKSE
jgi:hypothetical protein